MRQEFLTGRVFADVADAQSQLDSWVHTYNHDRPHQGIGMVPPWERFRLAAAEPATIELEGASPDTTVAAERVATRKVGANGQISFATATYKAGVWLAGETVEVVCDGRLVHLRHRGVLIATHARRHRSADEAKAQRRGQKRPTATQRPAVSVVSVTRKVDGSGNVSFAGTAYRVGTKFRRRQVQVAVVDATVQISIGEELIRTHPARHDRTREHGALANPGGRPRRINAA